MKCFVKKAGFRRIDSIYFVYEKFKNINKIVSIIHGNRYM